jgi:AP-2 complex subunit mu-1
VSSCRRGSPDLFRIHVIANPNIRSPINYHSQQAFLHVRCENLFIAAVTRDNPNVALIFEFLHKFIAIGKAYFEKFDEEAVKSNFVLIYELLDGIYYPFYLFNFICH